MKPILHYALCASLILLLWLPSPTRAQTPLTPPMLQQLQFTDELGRPYALSQYIGQPLLLHLWATWCAPCVREIPALVRLQADYSQKGLTLLPISQDFAVEDISRFYRSNGIMNLPLLLDRDSLIFKSIGTRGLPISILINRNGYEVRRFAGNTNWDSPQIRGMLNSLIWR